jgi:uncharacterized membrane protein YgcG
MTQTPPPPPPPAPPAPPAPRRPKATKVITLTVIGVVSVMVVGFCAAQGEDDVTADCVDTNAQLSDGSFDVVDDTYCDDDDNGGTHFYGGSTGAYHWYYGGTRIGNRIRGGSSYRPSNVNISSRSGHSIQRGGFGGRGSSGS